MVLGHGGGHVIGGDAVVGAAQVDDGRAVERLGRVGLHHGAVVAGGRREALNGAGREPGQRAAVAIAHDADLLAAGLQEGDAGGDVAHGLFPRRAHGVGDAGLDPGVVVVGQEARLAAVVHGGRDGLIAHLGPAGDVGADVLVDAEDLLDDDDPALARREGRLVIGGELEPSAPGDLDGFSHGRGLSGLDVEDFLHHVAVLDDILLAFLAQLAGVAGAGLALQADVVVEGDGLGADEALLKVGVDDAGGLRGGVALVDRPGARLLGARR